VGVTFYISNPNKEVFESYNRFIEYSLYQLLFYVSVYVYANISNLTISSEVKRNLGTKGWCYRIMKLVVFLLIVRFIPVPLYVAL
jgi:hypothetical protein